MSAGGVFKILTNDGKADQMLMATQLLKDRICDIIDARTAAGLKDTLPTLKDLEKTHVLHFQSKFKPFVALGYEYQKVKAQSGTTQLGGSVTFSIPQFGDFLSDMVLHIELSKCSYNAAAVSRDGTDLPPQVPGSPLELYRAAVPAVTQVTSYVASTSAGDVTTPFITTPAVSSVNEAKVASLYTVTLPDGSTVKTVNKETVGGSERLVIRRFHNVDVVDSTGIKVWSSDSLLSDRAFYCDYPGERLMKKVSFDVNGNPLDDYDAMSYAFHRKFRLTTDKLVAYNRNMGQQVSSQLTDSMSKSGLSKQVSVNNGPQTPQVEQPALSMWIKLLFWFNLDHSQSLVSAAIPYGQRFINVDLASVDDLIGRAPAAWHRVIMTTDVYTSTNTIQNDGSVYLATDGSNDIGKGAISTSEVLYYPIYTNGNLSEITIDKFDLYVNNIFTIPEVHDIYIERIGFSLIRVHRIQREGVNNTTKDILLSQFKYPVEFFYCGLRPDENVTNASINGSNAYRGNKYSDWHRFTNVSRSVVKSTSIVADVTAVNTTTTVASTVKTRVVSDDMLMTDYTRPIGLVSVTAHGVALYNTIDSSFFNQYIPEVYGGRAMIAPEDQGVLFINFCLHPYSMQPSGHINTSRAREFFIKLEDIILVGSSSSSTFLAEASALNFLLVSDGTAVLRYTT